MSKGNPGHYWCVFLAILCLYTPFIVCDLLFAYTGDDGSCIFEKGIKV